MSTYRPISKEQTMNTSVCISSAIWDLHIHSNKCTKPDKDLSKLPISEYIDRLLDILSDYPLLEMISFTDHNVISEELYRRFFARDTSIALLPGIEIDTKLTEGGISKHLIVYFDCVNDEDRLADLCTGVNAIMNNYSVGSENPIEISTLFNELLCLNFKFVVSPHAFKQEKRAIDWGWHVDGIPSPNLHKYTDQFFAFWETSGTSQISKAIEYLRSMDSEDIESIVSFSDSKNFNKLKAYLDNPAQYFAALPNFTGLQMVGSEISRITRTPIAVREDERGRYLGSITVDGHTIELSPRLNAIIGGRGSGKSVLLDRLALSLNESECATQLDDDDRLKFLNTAVPTVRCLSGQEVVPSSFQFEYFNQNYVSSLFLKRGEEFNKQLQNYFKSAFDSVADVDIESIRSSERIRFSELVSRHTAETADNLIDFVGKYVLTRDENLPLKLPKAPTNAAVKPRASLSYEHLRDTLNKSYRKDIPEILRTDPSVNKAFTTYETAIIRAAHAARTEYLEGDYLLMSLDSKLKAKRSELSTAMKNRQGAIASFRTSFISETRDARYRTKLIQAYFEMQRTMEFHYENHVIEDGESTRAFCFKKELDVQSPLDYLIACLDEYFLITAGGGYKCCRDNLFDYLDAFRFGSKDYKSGKSAAGLEQRLSAFELSYNTSSSIWYLSSREMKYENIAAKSPGTRTNILLEYIVHRNTNVPLLIDQPEDNVDNQTIYSQIKDWFISLKNRRQVIVVTHDANIVVNADAENVVIASQDIDGSFIYRNGALEYSDILEQASLILDGGVEAVRRRLMKYGG